MVTWNFLRSQAEREGASADGSNGSELLLFVTVAGHWQQNWTTDRCFHLHLYFITRYNMERLFQGNNQKTTILWPIFISMALRSKAIKTVLTIKVISYCEKSQLSIIEQQSLENKIHINGLLLHKGFATITITQKKLKHYTSLAHTILLFHSQLFHSRVR